MKPETYVRGNRRGIDTAISNRLGCALSEIPGTPVDFQDPTPRAERADTERRLWVLNDETLYRQARRYGMALSLLALAAVPAFADPCRVNVATCTAAECAYLPGIGPSKGAAIEAAHPTTEAELDAVPGIGGKTLEKLRPFLAYQGPTTCTSKQAAPKPEAADKDGAQ